MTVSEQPEYIYKIVGADLWEKAQDGVNLPLLPIDVSDGYMHFSSTAQLAKTLELYFAGQSGVVVLAVKVSSLPIALKWEASRGGELFPHLYADLPMAAIAWHEQLDVPASGPCKLPGSIL